MSSLHELAATARAAANRVATSSPAIKAALLAQCDFNDAVAADLEPQPATVIPGQWDATKATVDPNSAAKVQALLANVGVPYLVAGVARATSVTTDWHYSVPTQETLNPVAVTVPAGTQPGHSNDGILIVDDSSGAHTCFSNAHYDATSKRITSAYGITQMAPDTFTEPRPNSTSGGRLPLGFVSAEQIMAHDYSQALCVSVTNLGHGPALYPADTDYTNFPGNGLCPPVGTWLRLPSTVNYVGLDQLEFHLAARLVTRGAFIRDVGSTFGFYGVDGVNQGGQVPYWAQVGVTLEALTPAGYPYAHRFSDTFVKLLGQLQVCLPPPKP